jgi:hypothetical protein
VRLPWVRGEQEKKLNYGIAMWNGVLPLLRMASRFDGGADVMYSVQGLAALADPSGKVAKALDPPQEFYSTAGDPYVRWVDQMLYNNGQPLMAGSAPLYGSDGNSTAQEGLAEAAGLSLQLIKSTVRLIPGPFGLALNLGLAVDAASRGDWTEVAFFGIGALAKLNPCGLGPALSNVVRGAALFSAAQNVANFIVGLQTNDPFVGFHLATAASDLYTAFRSCFTGEMLLDVEGGKMRADAIQVGDRLWARDESDPRGPVALREVEEVFVRTAPIINLHVPDQIIRTTAEHPFYVDGLAWMPAWALQIGDLLHARNGKLL